MDVTMDIMKQQKGNSSILILFIIVFIVASTFLVMRSPKTSQNQPFSPALLLPTPTPAMQETNVHSGDGTMKLMMKTEKKPDGTSTYSFTATDISGNNPKSLLTKTVPPGGTMIIPQNTWSPDNKLVFLQENDPATSAATLAPLSIFILKASGELFADNQQYLDVTSLWTQRTINYTFKSATGWASPTLLIITTNKNDGTRGPSYWFDVPSKAFLQLAS